MFFFFFFSSRRRHTRSLRDWSSDVCSSDLEVLRDGETYSSGQIIELIMGDVMGKHIMLGMDDPEHRRYRALVSTAFGQKAIARWEAQLVEPIASSLIDRFAGRGHA